jgi:hypothetical protein
MRICKQYFPDKIAYRKSTAGCQAGEQYKSWIFLVYVNRTYRISRVQRQSFIAQFTEYDKWNMVNYWLYNHDQFSKDEFIDLDEGGNMKRWSAINRLLICGMGLVMAGLFLATPFTVNAAEQKVRFNIPGCMS